MMVFDSNVTSTRATSGGIGKFYTAFVVFKDSGICGSGTNSQLGD